MDKQQAKEFVTNVLLVYLPKVREQLEETKKITDSETRRREAELAYNYHWTTLQSAIENYQNYELWKEGIELTSYDSKVKELKKLQYDDEPQGNQRRNRNSLTHCSQCGRKSFFYHYIWDKGTKKLATKMLLMIKMNEFFVINPVLMIDIESGDLLLRRN